MKIVWITTRHVPDNGGMAQSSTRIVNSLRENGNNVTVIHLTKNYSNINPKNQGLTIIPDPDSLSEPARIFWQNRDLLDGAMLVGFGGNQAGYYAVLWAKWLNTKSFVLFRGNDFEKTIHDLKQAWMTHFIIGNADIIGTVSVEMGNRIKSLRDKPVIYIPNSIDIAEWNLIQNDLDNAKEWIDKNLSHKKPVVGMFGELKSKKGLDITFELFNAYEIHKLAYLLTVGSVPKIMVEKFETSCPESWTNIPFQPREEIITYYAVSDLIFIPSLYDGMPNVILEAMSLERVVIASRAGAMPEVIDHGKNGFLFDITDVNGAARIMNTALKMDSKEREQMGFEARKSIMDKYKPEHELKIILDQLKKLKSAS